jgi:hypothetical protein
MKYTLGLLMMVALHAHAQQILPEVCTGPGMEWYNANYAAMCAAQPKWPLANSDIVLWNPQYQYRKWGDTSASQLVQGSDGAFYRKDAFPVGNSGGAPPPSGTGSCTLKWTNPTTNSDGTALQDFFGITLRGGQASGNYTLAVPAGLGPSFQVTGLAVGRWYFVADAVDVAGNYSRHSNEATCDVVAGTNATPSPPILNGQVTLVCQTTNGVDFTACVRQ